MKALNTIVISTTGLSKLLSTRIYAQFIRPKMEYGLAIIKLNKISTTKLEKTQNTCIQMIYGARSKSSTKVMRHLTKLPSMKERTAILQAKFLRRALIYQTVHYLSLQPNPIATGKKSQVHQLGKNTVSTRDALKSRI